jgi:hypothetical protein
MMHNKHLFAVLMIVLSALAAGRYGWEGDWWRAGYWVAAAALTFCVVMMK